jgi:hypothetical protein
MPNDVHSRVVRMSRSDSGSAVPTAHVALVSPWTPSRNSVTSRLTMSPSRRTRLSGIPWQMTSFTDVQRDLGNGGSRP